MKVLIDTNVLISAALRDRLPERVVIFVATRDNWKWIVTDPILSEYVAVLGRPKFRIDAGALRRWSELLKLRTLNIGSPSVTPQFPRDPKDAAFLAAAVCSQADCLITGDRDLLDARVQISTRIVTVAEFAQHVSLSS